MRVERPRIFYGPFISFNSLQRFRATKVYTSFPFSQDLASVRLSVLRFFPLPLTPLFFFTWETLPRLTMMQDDLHLPSHLALSFAILFIMLFFPSLADPSWNILRDFEWISSTRNTAQPLRIMSYHIFILTLLFFLSHSVFHRIRCKFSGSKRKS